MLNLKPTKSNANDDRLWRDEEFMRKLRIRYRPQGLSSMWPRHLQKTFQSIERLGSIKYESYDDTVAPAHSTPTWRREIKSRAKTVSEVVERLVREQPSEMTWRLELEKLIGARFDMRTECRKCSNQDRSGRLWRSEVEVVAEGSGSITDDIELRRESRRPCSCDEVVYAGLNPLFSNRADQAFSYDTCFSTSEHNNEERRGKKGKERELPVRKPDRVYGLRETGIFKDRLDKSASVINDKVRNDSIAAVDSIIGSDCSVNLSIRSLIQSTPFHQRGEPLLFPFLVLEAKVEGGGGFNNCAVQTSLPIWMLLKSQERLSEIGGPWDELGGPLVWYIAYVGESWRISGCFISDDKDKKSYDILDLWNGTISSPNDALQILLIIDYIFDWARDLYRPTILQSLEAVADTSPDDSASVTADSDIFSSRKNPRIDNATEIESICDLESPETLATDQSLLNHWKEYDMNYWSGPVSINVRAIRPSYVVKSSFQCLYITSDNIGTFIASLGSNPSVYTKMARDALNALRCSPLVITERILSQIEDAWTSTPRHNRYAASTEKRFCSVVHKASISSTWELTRTIFCFAVDTGALEKIREYAAFKKKRSFLLRTIEGHEIVSEESVAAILETLSKRNDKENLELAFSQLYELWDTEFAYVRLRKIHLVPSENKGDHIVKFVSDTYRRHKQPGLLEPDYSYLRMSARLDRLETQSNVDHALGIPLAKEQLIIPRPLNSVLMLKMNRIGYHLCVYDFRVGKSSITWDDIVSALNLAVSETNFLAISADGLKVRPPREYLIPKIKATVAIWINDLCKKFDTKINQQDFPEIFSLSNDEISRYDPLSTFSSVREPEYRPSKKPMHYRTSNAPPPESPPETPLTLPLSTRKTEIETILGISEGDALTDDQLSILLELGHFK